jgi:transmembrane sensor
MKKDYSNIDQLIVSFLENELTGTESKTLQDWLAESNSNKIHFKQVYKIWAATDMLNANSNDVNSVLEKVKLQIQHSASHLKPRVNKTRQLFVNVGKWAAVVFVSVYTGALIYSRLEKVPSNTTSAAIYYNEVTVPLGAKSKIRLPDGTEVILNAGSKLSYSTEYGKKLREVEFSGEAYFKVAKNKNKPFIVHTSKTSIEALGTEFNVKAYPNENIIETILVEGSVAIRKTDTEKNIKGSRNNETIILKPGQMLQIVKNEVEEKQPVIIKPSDNAEVAESLKPIENQKDMRLGSIDVQIGTSWKDARWIIRGTNLKDLAVLLSRRFNVNIQLKDSTLNQYKFTGLIENETLEEVLNIIKFTIPINAKIDKGDVTWTVDRGREKDYKEAYK